MRNLSQGFDLMWGQGWSWLSSLYMTCFCVQCWVWSLHNRQLEGKDGHKSHAIPRINWNLGGQTETQVALSLPSNLQLWWHECPAGEVGTLFYGAGEAEGRYEGTLVQLWAWLLLHTKVSQISNNVPLTLLSEHKTNKATILPLASKSLFKCLL